MEDAPEHLHLDFETFSKASLPDVGAYRYARDESTEILCAAMAMGEGEPIIWDQLYAHSDYGANLIAKAKFGKHLTALENPDVLIYAHNAQFEYAICQALIGKTWGIKCPDISRFRCTVSLAHRAALPGKLETLAEVLGLSAQKDKRGKALIKLFCQMQPAKKPTKKNPQGIPERRIHPQDNPEAFAELCAYCQQDVRIEQGVAKALAYFDEPINNANYTLTERINSRGVTVNLDALRHAQNIIEQETVIVGKKFRELTGFEFTQGAKLLEWLHSQGCHLDNLQAETIEDFLAPWERKKDTGKAVTALRMKQSVAYASIKKIPTMLACAGPDDNRIRGMLIHHKATTGRQASAIVQWQNMKRPTIKHSEDAYREICAGISRDMLDCCYGPPLEVISSCIRHFMHDVKNDWTGNKCQKCFKGTITNSYGEEQACDSCSGTGDEYGYVENNFIDADYSAIEARIICWLAGQEDALQEYRDGVDRYRRMASVIYGIPPDEVNKHPQRFIGKQCILLSGFQGGPTKFRSTCEKFGYYDLPKGLEETAINTFRRLHPHVVRYWYAVEDAAKQAILHKGEVFRPIAKHRRGESKFTPLPVFADVRFKVEDIGGLPFLLIRLPSGRKLAYPRPQIITERVFTKTLVRNENLGALEEDSFLRNKIVFYGHRKGVQWGDLDTYGGKIAENITQATAADVMANGAHKAEAKGYEIATMIHDEALSYFKPKQTPDEFVNLLVDLPPWAKGLPIEAEGGLVPFYKKD